MNEILIRQEIGEDIATLYNLIKKAFETAKVKDGDEQDFAENLRRSENCIPELALIAEKGGKLIGQVMFTKTYITQTNGERFECLMLAPISVLLEYRNQGVGATLIKEGFKRAKLLGYKAILLCGDPAYYGRFGFKPISHWGITHQTIPEPYVMGYELIDNALKEIKGIARVE
jgi:Predicted acetyltransferase